MISGDRIKECAKILGDCELFGGKIVESRGDCLCSVSWAYFKCVDSAIMTPREKWALWIGAIPRTFLK